MPRSNSKDPLKQPGFYIDPGFAFPDHETAIRIYTALLGDDFNDPPSLDEAKQRGAATLEILFRAVLGQSVLFKALRGSGIVWGMIVARAILFDEISVPDAKLLVEKMCAARQAYRGKVNHDTELTRLADQCTALAQETAALGPPVTFTVAQRDRPGSNDGGSPVWDETLNTLASTLASLNITEP